MAGKKEIGGRYRVSSKQQLQVNAIGAVRMKCWELTKCGKEKDCPAYPENGTRCAHIRGTSCHSNGDNIVKKVSKCFNCVFFNSEYYDKYSAIS